MTRQKKPASETSHTGARWPEDPYCTTVLFEPRRSCATHAPRQVYCRASRGIAVHHSSFAVYGSDRHSRLDEHGGNGLVSQDLQEICAGTPISNRRIVALLPKGRERSPCEKLTARSGAGLTVEVDHSGPIGVRSLCSCWAALVYGNGKSLSMYLAAFLSLRSLIIT